MKISFQKERRHGSVLLICLFTTVAVGTVLASFLALTGARYNLSMRSTSWNASMPVAEAGVEEAMTQLNYYLERVKTNLSTSFTSNNWIATNISGVTVYTKTTTLPDSSYYYVAVYNATTNTPLIYSSGFTRSPLATNTYISRLVRVGVSNSPTLFSRAIAATQTIDMSGSAFVDSYDSRKGGYNTSVNRNANGSIATTSTAAAAIKIGNADVFGKVEVGPGGSISIGSSGAVGDAAWIAGSTGIEPGWSSSTMTGTFPTNAPPSGGPFPAPLIASGVMILGSATNQVSSFSGSGSSVVIKVNGNATLYVTGSFSLSGSSYVQINPGGSLKLIVGGSASLSGGGVVNTSAKPANFSLLGLPTCTSVTLSGNSALYGNVNAPQADLTMSGTSDIYGAAIVKSATASGGGSFHYDEALSRSSTLLLDRWQEK